MAVRWWNINGRWNVIDKNFMKDYDILFLIETHCNCTSMPVIDGFKAIGDPNFPLIASHGGVMAYIKCDTFEHIQQIRYGKCSISFNFTFAPKLVFIAVYVYPYDSLNFTETDFATLSTEIEYWLCRGFIPIIGGDFNARVGNLNAVNYKALNWRYDDNTDSHLNQHGKALRSICEILKISPINHSKFYDRLFDGNFTYFKAGKKSQIDLLITNDCGRRLIDNFSITQTGWHISDHLPLDVSLCIDACISANMLANRSKELIPYIPSQQPLLKAYRYIFNEESARNQMLVHATDIQDICINNQRNPNKMLQEIEACVIPIITAERTKTTKSTATSHDEVINNCDILFKQYLQCLDDDKSTQEALTASYNEYQEARSSLNNAVLMQHENEYTEIIKAKDDRKLWNKIDWGGNMKTVNSKNHPDITDLADHFETLYQPLPQEHITELDNLTSDVYIPINDDPISDRELVSAASSMKKGGWDYSLSVLKLMVSSIPGCILLLINAMFFFAYPIKLAISVLHAIPKTGNLMLPSNYRGIQVQPLLALLYDRILANRLISWASINYEQSAFQKGKSTLNHIFTLRTLIALSKRYKKSFYIGFFDLSKAFDKVSRVLLIKSLIKMGIGSCLLEAIKATYKVTRCVLKGFGKLSDVFLTFSGIKQGAPSSVILFIIFMDDVIDVLKEKCVNELLLNNLHALLHADDTLVFSFDRDLFIAKCNILIDSFHEKKLQLNLKKSSYMIIDTSKSVIKVDLKLKSGWLPYSATTIYLGALFNDAGLISSDINQHASDKNKSVSIKLANFVTNNLYAPITVKYKIQRSCVSSAILYSCETWSYSNLSRIEALYRRSIKTCTKMKANTPNDIAYIESGCSNLACMIYKRQYKFWSKIKEDLMSNPESPISKVYQIAIDARLPFIKHYIDLHAKFSNENECFQFYLNRDTQEMHSRMRRKAQEDREGIYGTYLTINPNLVSPIFYHSYCIRETDRLLLTKYRSGSHFLNIQKGRCANIQRSDRLCVCKDGVQDLPHVLFNCERTEIIRDSMLRYSNLHDFFCDINKAPDILRTLEHKLKLR